MNYAQHQKGDYATGLRYRPPQGEPGEFAMLFVALYDAKTKVMKDTVRNVRIVPVQQTGGKALWKASLARDLEGKGHRSAEKIAALIFNGFTNRPSRGRNGIQVALETKLTANKLSLGITASRTVRPSWSGLEAMASSR